MYFLPRGQHRRAQGAVELVGKRVGEAAGREHRLHQRVAVRAAWRSRRCGLAARAGPGRRPASRHSHRPRKSAKVTKCVSVEFGPLAFLLGPALGQSASSRRRSALVAASARDGPPGRQRIFRRRLVGLEHGDPALEAFGIESLGQLGGVGWFARRACGRQQVAADFAAPRAARPRPVPCGLPASARAAAAIGCGIHLRGVDGVADLRELRRMPSRA